MSPMAAPSTLAVRSDPQFDALKRFVVDTTGLAYFADKDDDLADRISRRLGATGESDCGAYLTRLRSADQDGAEIDRLIEEVTVGETSFFRHAELFEGIRTKVMPDLLARNAAVRRLRIWSAGCSIGAEPYSISLLLHSCFADETRGWDVSIVGTDINQKVLAQASAGCFREWDLRGLSAEQIKTCFDRRGQTWHLRPEYRKGVTFHRSNMAEDPFLFKAENAGGGGFDLILCRNVLIYFSSQTMRRLIGRFHAALADGGWLLVGHAEPNVEMFRAFTTVNVPGAVMYQRPTDAADRAWKPGEPVSLGGAAASLMPAAEQRKAGDPARAAFCGTTPLTGDVRAEETCERSPAERVDLDALQRHADAGDAELVRRRIERLTPVVSLDTSVQVRLAMLAEQVGLHGHAATLLERALRINPDDPFFHYLSGWLSHKLGRSEEASAAYARALRLMSVRADDESLSSSGDLVVHELRELVCMQQRTLAP